ncbi:MAG: tRNA (N6-threonylcarbamoyladenosine(37)-N6)-methyltransferase TrmO [Anaerolineaceae bacterium]
MSQDITVHAIGHVKAEEGNFEIHVLPHFAPALEKLEDFSHVMILWWADRQDPVLGRNTLTVELPYAPGVQAGVFACRSEYRPNPIGVTVMPILGIDQEKGVLTLPWIDAFDGTPVLDLKPYLPVSDRVRDVKVADWMQDWPVWMEDAGEFFAKHETNFGN